MKKFDYCILCKKKFKEGDNILMRAKPMMSLGDALEMGMKKAVHKNVVGYLHKECLQKEQEEEFNESNS